MFRFLALLLLLPINTALSIDQVFSQEKGLEISEIQGHLGDDDGYLMYDKTSLYYITQGKFEHHTIDVNEVEKLVKAINREVKLFYENPFDHDPQQFKFCAKKLHQLLIRCIQPNLKSNLHIFATSEYLMVPWNALIDSSGQFLIENFTLTIKKDITAKFVQATSNRKAKVHVIAPKLEGPYALNVQKEKNDILKKLRGITSDTNNCDILHISSHGLVDTSCWSKSGIMMEGSRTLTNQEVSEWNLNAKLVFLNICEGAKAGSQNKSIVDAFYEAGAASTIGNLWEIDDRLASKFSSIFYDELAKGHSTSLALQKAHIRYQKEFTLKSDLHPLRWAGYQVYGADVDIKHQEELGYQKIISLMLSIFTTFSLVSYYFGKKIKSIVLAYDLI